MLRFCAGNGASPRFWLSVCRNVKSGNVKSGNGWEVLFVCFRFRASVQHSRKFGQAP